MEKLCTYTEELLADIVFCGFENISAETMSRLQEVSEKMNELGMTEGSRIAQEICNGISAFRRHETDECKISGLIGVMEMYLSVLMH